MKKIFVTLMMTLMVATMAFSWNWSSGNMTEVKDLSVETIKTTPAIRGFLESHGVDVDNLSIVETITEDEITNPDTKYFLDTFKSADNLKLMMYFTDDGNLLIITRYEKNKRNQKFHAAETLIATIEW